MELILRVSAEGGDIKLYGEQVGQGWRFRRSVNDQTPLLIDEPGIEHDSEIADSWDGAIRLMDQYPWHRLSPRFVHPEFRKQVWAEVRQRAGQGLVTPQRVGDWQSRCNIRNVIPFVKDLLN